MGRSKRVRVALAIGGVLVALAVLLLAVIHLPFVRRGVLEQGRKFADGSGFELEATDLQYNLLTGNVSLEGIVLRAKGAADTTPIFQADIFEANLGLRGLLAMRLVLEEGRLVRPQLAAIYLADGGSNLPTPAEDEAAPAEASGQPLAWSIESFSVQDGSILLEDRDLPLAVALPNWSLALSGTGDGRTQLAFSSDLPGSVSWQGRESEIETLAISGSLSGQDVDLSDIQIDLPAMGAAGTGSILFGGDPAELNVDLDLTADAARLADYLELDQDVAGTTAINVRGGGSLEAVALSLEARSESFRYQTLDNIALDVAAGWTMGADIVDLPRANVSADFGEVDASGRIAIDAGATSFVSATIADLRLAPLTREFATDLIVASTAAGAAELSWQGTTADEVIESLVGFADLRLSPGLSSPRESTVPVAGTLRLRAENGRKTLDFSSLSALGATGSGQVQINAQERLSGQVTMASDDVGAGYSAVQTFLGEPIDEAARIGGRLSATLNLGGTIENPQATAVVVGEQLAAGEIADSAIEIRADYRDDQVVIDIASLAWAEQQATLAGRVDLRGEQTALDLTFDAESLDVGALRSAVGNQTPIDGTISVHSLIRGTTELPAVQASVSAVNLVAYGQTFGAMTAELALTEGVAHIDRLRLDQPNPDGQPGELSASGEYRLEDGLFSFVAEGRSISLEQLEIAAQESLGGTLAFDLAAEGTTDVPQVSGNASLSGSTYQGRELGDLQVNLSTQDNRARIAAQAAKFNAALNAEVDLAAPHAGTVELQLNNTDLSQLNLNGPKGESVSGTVTAALTAQGEVDNWQDGSARLVVREAAVQAVERLPLRTNGEIVLRYEDRTLIADQAAVAVGQSTFDISGRLPLEEPVVGDQLAVGGILDLNELASFIPSETPVGASGRVEMDATVGGSLTAPMPEGEVRLLEAAVFNEAMFSPLTSLNGTVRLSGETVELEELTGDWAGAKLVVNGSAPTSLMGVGEESAVAQPIRLEWSLNGLVIDSLTDLPRGTGGRVSLAGHVEGVAPDIAALEGDVNVTELDVYYDDIRLSQTQPSRLSLSSGVLTVDSFDVTGPRSQAALSGDVQISPEIQLNLDFSLDTDAAVLALAADRISAAGPVRLRIAARGAASDPELTGELAWDDGEVAASQSGFAGQDLNVEVALTPGRAEIQRFSGSVNGGSLEVSGGFGYEGGEPTDVDLAVKVDGVFLEIPDGLRTVSNTDLTIRSEDDTIVIAGNVDVEEGVYREPVEFDVLLLDLLRSSGGVTDFVSEPNPLLASTRFNVTVHTVNPIIVDNNLAQLGATLDVRLTGSYYRPGLVGRAELEEGGELYISENRYFVDRGVIDFLNESRVQPTLDILARTKVRNQYDIELAITGGGPEPVATNLTSPSHTELGEPDLISLLLTGRLRENLRGEEVNVAAEQSLSYLTGRIGGRLSQAAQDTLGLSEVRIEPNLIAAESDPGARLTVGQNLNSYLSLVYSMNLADSSDQIWTVRYDVTRRFQARGVRQADDTYRFDFQHDLRFGGGQDAGRTRRSPRAERLVGDVTVAGDHPLSEEEIRSKLKAKEGRPYDFFAISKGSDKIERKLEKQGYLEAKVTVEREVADTTVDLLVTVQAGPQVNLIFEGWSPSGKLRDSVRQLWSNGVFDAQRLDDSRRTILADLTARGYLAAEFRTEVTASDGDDKRVLFEIYPNTRFEDVELVFEGANAFEGKDLRSRLKDEGLLDGIYADSAEALDFLESFYRAEGYLDVEINVTRQELNAANRSAQVIVPITEGPQYRVGELTFSGNERLTEQQLRRATNLPADPVYNPQLLQRLFLGLEEEYWQAGFQDVELTFQMEKSDSEPSVRVNAVIVENRQSVIERIQVAGNRATSENLALSQLGIEPGKPLNFAESTSGRRALYNTGAYTLVDLSYNPIESTGVPPDPGVKPVEAALRLREVQPYQVYYGGSFDSERGPGGILDFRNRNTLGAARTIGARLRADAEFREARAFFSQPLLRRFPLSTNFVTFISRTKRPGESFDVFDYRRGFSISQETRWKNRYILNYGYRFEKLVSEQDPPDPFFPDPIRLNVTPFTVSFTRETRDDILDATRGDFASNALEWSPTQLGGANSLHFVRYFGQYFRYFPLAEPTEIPYGGNARRSRLVYATGARIGLSRGLGGQVIPDAEKFFAGGGTTVRGFAEDELGGADSFGPFGGNAVFVLNNELRFPLRWIFDGVTFLDIGNVYNEVSDFDITDLRGSAGVGLRVRTPFFLIRADYGFKLDRRPGESAGQFFFSIGQAF